jgi:hypothetical protein
MLFTLVTGANSKYFNYLNQLLNNVFKIIENEDHCNITINVIVYDLGLSDKESNILKKTFPNIILETFDFSKYPEHLSLNKYQGYNCSYAWKPVIIHEVCEKYGDLVHWMDTRNLYSSFINLIDIINNHGIYSPVSSGDIVRWTHPTTIKLMNGYEYCKKECRAGGVVGINYNIEWCKDLIKEWKDLALIKEYIVPDGSNRDNHRQDQAVLQILYYKYQEKYNFTSINHYIDFSVHNGT